MARNFECIGGPFNGIRIACERDPYEGFRLQLFCFDGELKREVFYELRRHETLEMITGDGFWQWHFVNA